MTTLEAIQEQRTRKLPPGWRWETLSNLLLALESGSRPPGGALGITSGVPSISAEQMTERGTLDFSVMRYVPRDYYQEMQRGHILEGDILIVKDGATTGKTCFVDESFPFQEAVVNEHVFICRPNPEIIVPRFLFYWLWSPPGYHAIRSTFQGSAIGGINQRFADAIKVPVAPIKEQRRIVAILDEQMAAVERARIASDHRLEAAGALRSALFKSLLENGEAKQWPLRSIKDVSTLVVDGPHVTPRYVPKGVPFVTVKNIVQRTLDLRDVNYVSEEDHKKFCKRGKPEQGDILYSKDGTMGIPCLVETDEEFSFFVSVALIKPDRKAVCPRYLAYALEAPSVLAQVERLGAGAGLKHMVLKSIRALQVPVPPKVKQESLAAMLREKLERWNSIMTNVREEREALNALPGVLLRHAFEGRL